MTRNNARWHEPDQITIKDPSALRDLLQDARDLLAQAMNVLDGDGSDGDRNEAQEDIYSAVAWIDHAAHLTTGVSMEKDPWSNLADPDEHDWRSGYVEL